MKRTVLLSLFLFLWLDIVAQTPEPIYGFARVQMPLAWYRQQSIAWKKEVDQHPKNANAWYNLYRVNRNLARTDSTDTRSMEQRSKDLKALVERMGKAVPNTYEYNLCKWMTGGNNMAYLPYLRKAMELGEGQWEHLQDVVIWGEVERDLNRRDQFSQKWMKTGEVSTGLLYYNHNVLTGLPANTILFTSGDNDTFPCWILQAQGIRRDVTVVNTSLLRIDAYREKLFKELGVEKWDLGKLSGNDISQTDSEKFEREIIKHMAGNQKGYPVSVALTTSSCSNFTKAIEDHLYLTGLAYEYKTEPMDNMALLRRNFEQKYALDYVDKPFYTDISTQMVGEMNRNYLVPMLKLYDHYKAAGETRQQDWMRGKLLAVSKGTSDEAQIRKAVADSQ